MSRGPSTRMLDIVDFMKVREEMGIPFATVPEVIGHLLPDQMRRDFTLGYGRHRRIPYSHASVYRSVGRTMKLLEKRGLIAKQDRFKHGLTGWITRKS